MPELPWKFYESAFTAVMLKKKNKNPVSKGLTHCGRVTQYGDGSMLCKTPIFFTMKEFPQI